MPPSRNPYLKAHFDNLLVQLIVNTLCLLHVCRLLELQLAWPDHNCLVWNTGVSDSLKYCLVCSH